MLANRSDVERRGRGAPGRLPPVRRGEDIARRDEFLAMQTAVHHMQPGASKRARRVDRCGVAYSRISLQRFAMNDERITWMNRRLGIETVPDEDSSQGNVELIGNRG